MTSRLPSGPAASDGAGSIPRPRASGATASELALEARIHRLSAEGASPYSIAAALNTEGLLTVAGKRWHRSSVARVLWHRQPREADRELSDSRWSTDATTQLMGREGLLTRADSKLTEAAEGTSTVMLVMDVDAFRHVNSAFGHLTGDAVLSDLADRLCGLATADDVIARVGSDAFAVVTSAAGCDVEALQLAVTRVESSVREPFRTLTGADVALAVKTGVACATSGATSGAELLRNAELALYRAKREHTPWAVYQAERDEPAAAGLVQATELRWAIAAGELEVHYQPIVDLRTGLPHSVEALARWRHPTRGLVPPGEFLPVAEKFDLMGELTDAVVSQVSAQLRDWAGTGRSLPCAINLTASCLTDPRCAESLIQSLIDLGGSLTVEVVESVMADADAVRVLERLAAGGVVCSIDDFGTGYSSLGSLKTLPASTLKIDRSLIRDINSDSRDVELVLAVVRLAGSFGLQVIAEGVETERAAVLLREAGVQLAQGFWFARPMPADELERWLDAPSRIAGTASVAGRSEQDRHGGDHEVVLHSDDSELLAEVARYIGEGLADEGQAILVVAPDSRYQLLAALPRACRETAEQEGRLLVLDARETLALFMRDGAPDPVLFETCIAGVLRQRMAQFPGLRAYGEMTTILWQDGNVTGALALEELWASFQKQVPFPLLCAYPLADLLSDDGAWLGQLLRRHTATRVLNAGARAPDRDADTMDVLLDASRELLRIDAAEQAVGILIRTVAALGGSTGPAQTASPASLPIDLSLGHADPILPRAPPGSQVRDTLAALLPALVEDARVAASKADRLATLSDQVDTDPLTGLTNRRGLRRTRHAVDSDCLVVVDLDRFKHVNDTLGHDAGDRVLVAFSRAARQHLRSTDLVFRLGGDEFLIVLPGTTTANAETVIQKLRRHWEEERPFPVTFSAGIAAVVGNDLEESIRAADGALHGGKSRGRNSTGVAVPSPGKG